jgi:transcriptional regulator with XRE-family HTH domain
MLRCLSQKFEIYIDKPALQTYYLYVRRRGRPTKTRTSELGIYIKQRRDELGWSIRDLAHHAEVSYKTLSKLELDRNLPRRPEIFLLKIARALGVHPDRLLVRASLTPILRAPMAAPIPVPPTTIPLTLLVTDDERRELEDYLQYLRHITSVESLRRRAEAEIGPSANEEPPVTWSP